MLEGNSGKKSFVMRFIPDGFGQGRGCLAKFDPQAGGFPFGFPSNKPTSGLPRVQPPFKEWLTQFRRGSLGRPWWLYEPHLCLHGGN